MVMQYIYRMVRSVGFSYGMLNIRDKNMWKRQKKLNRKKSKDKTMV